MINAEIIVVGQFNADVIVKPVSQLPDRGLLGYVDTMEMGLGGCGLNTTLCLHKLGIRVVPLAKLGNDAFGDFIFGKMGELGLMTDGVKRAGGQQTSSIIVFISTQGERSFLYRLGSNEETSINDINLDMCQNAKILHVGGIMKMTKLDIPALLRQAKQRCAITSCDTDWINIQNWLPLIEPSLKYIDVFMPSFEEAKQISNQQTPQKMAEFFLPYGIKIFVLKMGDKGCYIRTNDTEFVLPACKIDTVVDTTGAGDAFSAGFLAGLCKGYDVYKCACLANACGSLCVTKVGTTNGIVNWDETCRFMETNYDKKRLSLTMRKNFGTYKKELAELVGR
jgi:sugar/nucleoside kinase (ribokinase family)